MTKTAGANDPLDQRHDDEFTELPSNLEAEQALLGALLIANDGFFRVSGFLQPEHFFEDVHGRIYEHIAKIVEKGRKADPTVLKPYFEDDPALEDVGGWSYLVRLVSAAPTTFNPEDYGRTIYDLAIRRRLMEIGDELMADAGTPTLDVGPEDLVAGAEQKLFDVIESGRVKSGARKFVTHLKTALDITTEARKDPDSVAGIAYSLKALDKKMAGAQKSDLIIVAGRPSMGKTAIATHFAFEAARRHMAEPENKHVCPVAFFSLEMSGDQLANRILASRTGIESDRLRHGHINQTEMRNLIRGVQEIEDAPLLIDDTPALTVAQLRNRVRRLIRTEKIGLIVVDYIQLMRGSFRYGKQESRVNEVSEISAGLKAIAKEFNMPVIALSQLSRQVEQRHNKRPMLSDLRESGSLEQDADAVIFVYRDEYYLERQEPEKPGSPEWAEWSEKYEASKGIVDCIISKNRHGPIGTVKVKCDWSVLKFTDIEIQGVII